MLAGGGWGRVESALRVHGGGSESRERIGNAAPLWPAPTPNYSDRGCSCWSQLRLWPHGDLEGKLLCLGAGYDHSQPPLLKHLFKRSSIMLTL